MTVQEQTNPQDEAQKIWDQLDAEESGKALPDDKAEGTQATESSDSQQQSDQRQQAPADQADASAGAGTESNEQSLMDKIAGLESMLGQVTTRLRNAEGHIGGLNGQLKQQQQQIDMEMAQQKAALEMQLMREKEAAKLMLEREKQQAYFAMKQQEFEAEAQLKAMKIGAGITSNVEIKG